MTACARRTLAPLLLAVCAIVAATSPASADVPFVYSAPSGHYHGKALKAIVQVIHGGGWYLVGQGAMDSMNPDVKRFTDRGYGVFNTDYSVGAQSLPDVLSIYDRARAFFGPSMPICTMGASAGGHLSLMIAVLRSGVACVDAEAAPTDCLTAQDPIATLCARYFGDADGQASFSPARRATSIHAPVLLSAATNDTVVYAQQMATMKAALPSANTVLLSPGPAQFVHSTVNASELRRLRNTEKTFMAGATAAWARAHQRPAPSRSPCQKGMRVRRSTRCRGRSSSRDSATVPSRASSPARLIAASMRVR